MERRGERSLSGVEKDDRVYSLAVDHGHGNSGLKGWNDEDGLDEWPSPVAQATQPKIHITVQSRHGQSPQTSPIDLSKSKVQNTSHVVDHLASPTRKQGLHKECNLKRNTSQSSSSHFLPTVPHVETPPARTLHASSGARHCQSTSKLESGKRNAKNGLRLLQTKIGSRTAVGESASTTISQLRQISGPAMHTPQKFNSLGMFSLRCTQVEENAEKPSSIKLTRRDEMSVRQSEQTWEEELREKRAKQWRSNNCSNNATDCTTVVLSEADVDVQHEQEQGVKKAFRYGIYGPVKVWIDRNPPKPPTMEPPYRPPASPTGKNAILLLSPSSPCLSPQASKAILLEQQATTRVLNSQLTKREVLMQRTRQLEAAEAEEDKKLLQDEINRSEGKKESKRKSKYVEDTEYTSFFLQPPPVLTYRVKGDYKPAIRVLPEELPNPDRPRPRGKGAVCMCFRATGLTLTRRGSLFKKDKQGLLRTLCEYLRWVRFMVVKYENGLEVRSTRTLEPDDFDIFKTDWVNRKQGRVRVALLVWVNAKDVTEAARSLATAVQGDSFYANLVYNCPSLLKANNVQIPNVLVPKLLTNSVAEGSPEDNGDERYTKEEVEKYSVLSTNSSAALWNIGVRINAGLEVTPEMLEDAKRDLAERRKIFECTNRQFEEARRWTQEHFKGAKGRIENWRDVLYTALVETEYANKDEKSEEEYAQEEARRATIAHRRRSSLSTLRVSHGS